VAKGCNWPETVSHAAPRRVALLLCVFALVFRATGKRYWRFLHCFELPDINKIARPRRTGYEKRQREGKERTEVSPLSTTSSVERARARDLALPIPSFLLLASPSLSLSRHAQRRNSRFFTLREETEGASSQCAREKGELVRKEIVFRGESSSEETAKGRERGASRKPLVLSPFEKNEKEKKPRFSF
jgi:hypothetical protein